MLKIYFIFSECISGIERASELFLQFFKSCLTAVIYNSQIPLCETINSFGNPILTSSILINNCQVRSHLQFKISLIIAEESVVCAPNVHNTYRVAFIEFYHCSCLNNPLYQN